MAEKRRIYFDNNATTPLHPEVKQTITEFLDVFGNPSSLHAFGREAHAYVEDARGKVARFIGAQPEEIMFAGSGSEGNNTVLSILNGQCRACEFGSCRNKDLVTTAIEHPCILETSRCLQEAGIRVHYAKVDGHGKVDLDQLKDLVTEHTGLVSVMMANNEIGTVQDLKAISRIAHEKGALFHTDAVQAVGKIPVNVDEIGADFLTLSGHKIYGP